jgi:lipid II:glycine glycyltransferase (peptidoglycan interpeptide bridge formation enzyme)
MIKLLSPDDIPSVIPDWNAGVYHPMQTIEWAKIRERHGLKVFCIEEDGDTTNKNKNTIYGKRFVFTLHHIPFTKYTLIYCPKSLLPSQKIISAVNELAQRYNSIFTKFEPNVAKNDVESLPSTLVRSVHPIFTENNQVLDLRHDIDTLTSHLHHKTRYNIKLAQKKGVVVVEANDFQGYSHFEKLYFETCKRQRYRGHDRSYHKAVWSSIARDNYLPDKLQARIYFARHDADVLSAMQVWSFKKKAYYVYGGSSNIKRSYMSANLLMWRAIIDAKNDGCTEFDMWGSLPKDYDESDKWAGFTRFKSGYGTKFAQYVAGQDLVHKPIAYQIYNALYKIRQKLI